MSNYEFEESVIEGKTIGNIEYVNQMIEGKEFINTIFEKVDFSATVFNDVAFDEIEAKEVIFEKCKMESDQLVFIGKFEKCNWKESEINCIESISESIFINNNGVSP